MSSRFYTFEEASRDSFSDELLPRRACIKIPKLAQAKGLPDHVLQAMTVNELKFASLRLHGRDNEQRTIADSFERSSIGCGPELVLIGGSSGTGKTLLASSIEPQVRRSKGFFLSGKCEPTRQMEPFVPFASAFQQLCHYLDEERAPSNQFLPAGVSEIRAKFREELGEEVHLLAKLIPDLQKLLQVDIQEDLKVEATNAKNRFRYAVRRLVRAITSFGPMVLLLDDLQWVDNASLELLESLASDRDASKLLFIAAYRSDDDEIHDRPRVVNHRFQQVIARVESAGVRVTELQLNNLTKADVNSLLAELLSMNSGKTPPLAELVHSRTMGNAFFVTRFLQSIKDSGFLSYSFGTLQWNWDIDQIERSTRATANVADLMREKLGKLPFQVSQVLRLVACVGAIFDETIVSFSVEFALECNADRATLLAREMLEYGKREGLLEDGELQSYRFVHDKVQEAAVALIPLDQRKQTEYAFGNFIVERLGIESLGPLLFIVTDLLDRGVSPSKLTDSDRIRMAQLNLLSGTKAVESAAFSEAVVYFEKGINVLPSGHWQSDYSLSLMLYSSATEAEYCMGNLEAMHLYSQHVLTQEGRPALDKLRVQCVLLESLSASGDNNAAVDMCRQMLKQFGYRFPKSNWADTLRLAGAWCRTRWQLRGKKAVDLTNIPVMTDPSRVAVMMILRRLGTVLYYSDPDLLGLVIFRGMQYSLRYGISHEAADIFGGYGLLLANYLGDPKGGHEYGDLTMALIEKHGFRAAKCKSIFTLYCAVMHWSEPVHLCLKPLLESYEVGMATGDMEHAMWSIYTYLLIAYKIGKPLHKIETDFREYTEQMQEFKQTKVYRYACILYQLILNLMGKSDHTYRLIGDALNEDELLKLCEETRDQHLIDEVNGFRMCAAYYFGKLDLAAQIARNLPDWLDHSPGCSSNYIIVVVNGLVCFAMARKTGKRRYWSLGKKWTYRVGKWVKGGCASCAHLHRLLEAELASLNRRKEREAENLYRQAILLASRGGFLSDQALANELYGEFLLGKGTGDNVEGARILAHAHALYIEWGALGKAQQLQSKYPFFEWD